MIAKAGFRTAEKGALTSLPDQRPPTPQESSAGNVLDDPQTLQLDLAAPVAAQRGFKSPYMETKKIRNSYCSSMFLNLRNQRR